MTYMRRGEKNRKVEGAGGREGRTTEDGAMQIVGARGRRRRDVPIANLHGNARAARARQAAPVPRRSRRTRGGFPHRRDQY